MRRLYIEKTKLRDISNQYHKHLRDEARIEVLRDAIVEAVSKLAPLPFIQPALPQSQDRQVEAILSFGDLHIGPEFINSYNSYSPEIARKRVQHLASEVAHYCQSLGVNKLYFLNLGDAISGNIHPTLRIEQAMDVVDQTVTAMEIISEMLNYLQGFVSEIEYRSVVDNHARLNVDKNEHIESENMGRILDWMIEERLKNTSIKFMHDNLDYTMGKFTMTNGKMVMFAHGHLDPKNSVIQNCIGMTHEVPDYILLAHYHNPAEKAFQGIKVIITGSIIGTDPYAYSKRLFSHPEQKLLIFDNDNFMDIGIDLANIK